MNNQYDKIYTKYHEHMSKLASKRDNDFLEQLGLVKTNIDVLEYGCGSGIDAKKLLLEHSNIKSYLGIDNSERMVKLFLSNVIDDRASSLVADIDTYIPSKNTYDFVYGIFSIHYTNSIFQLMKRVYASLKVGGYFVFKDTHPFVGFFKKKSKKYNEKENVDFPISGGGSGIFVKHPTFTIEEYVNSASVAGFQILSVKETMGTQSKALGIDDYEIPTMITFCLRK